MKRRPPPQPPVVVTRPSRRPYSAPAAPPEPRRAPPDRRIRAWNADDRERQEQEQFERKSPREQLEEAITWWVARYKRANDPDIERRIGRQGVGRDLTEAS